MTATKSKTESLMDQLRTLTKLAEQGESSHPTETADDGAQPNREGEQAKETDQILVDNNPLAVDGKTPPTEDREPDGATTSGTGEDPEVEKNISGTIPEETGTAHPANMNYGEKYSSWTLDKIAADIAAVQNSVLADIAAMQKAAETGEPSVPASAQQAMQAGAALADQVVAAQKSAGAACAAAMDDATVANFISATIKESVFRADLVAEYLAAVKKAESEEESETETTNKTEEPTEATEDDAASSGLAAALGGYAQPVGEEPPPEAVMPPASEMAGDPVVDPAAADPQQAEVIEALLQQLLASGQGPAVLAESNDPSIQKLAACMQHRLAAGSFTVRPAKNAREKKLRDEAKKFLDEVK